MKLCNDRYSVDISIEKFDRLLDCDTVYCPRGIAAQDDFAFARVFRISSTSGRTMNIALVDVIVSEYENCAVLSEDCLTSISFRSIVQIDLTTGSIIRIIPCDNLGGLFEIYMIENGYIIYGENTIYRFDLELNEIWHFSGRDIFASSRGEKTFWINEGKIHCIDWLDWHYVLDFDGNVISEQHITQTL